MQLRLVSESAWFPDVVGSRENTPFRVLESSNCFFVSDESRRTLNYVYSLRQDQ